MSDIKISAFPQASTLNGAEMIPATQGTTPVKILTSQISTKVQGDIAVQTFSAVSLTNPYTSSISPHRIGDIALNLTSLEIWQATSVTASASSWNRVSGGFYGGSVLTDLNTPVSSGYYTALGTASNVPDSAYSWFVNHVNSNTGNISAYQRAVAYSTTIIVYERTKINSVWGAWTSFAQQVQENVLSCGIQFNFDAPATALTRIGNDNIKNEIFSTCIRPVTLNDSGVVTQELATNINYKTNGQASDLTGASGQCMVGIKKFYIKRTVDAQNRLTKLQFSLIPLPGFTLHEKFTWGNGRDEIFVGMFEASTSGTLMQSIVGGSIYSGVTLATARAQAVARGTGWHTYDFYTQDVIQSLWYLYFAELNSQVSLPGYTELSTYADSYRRTTGRTKVLTGINGSVAADATNDSDIYSGVAEHVRLTFTAGVSANDSIVITLGTHVNTIPVTTSYSTSVLLAAYIATLTFTGYTVSYTAGNAYVDFIATTIGTVNTHTYNAATTGATGTIAVTSVGATWNDTNKYIANRFFWIENMFGHVWKMIDGCSPDGRVAGSKHMFATPNPDLFSSDQATILSTYTDLGIPMASSSNESYISSIGVYSNPITLGGSSSTYVTDYNWSYLADATKDYCRLLLAGGVLYFSATAGIAARYSAYGLANTNLSFGFRLCFERK